MTASSLEALLGMQLRALGVKPYVPELKFGGSLGRKWRWDMAWPAENLAVEIQGGTFIQGRHTTGSGYEADTEKQAAGILLGWRCLVVTGKQVEDGRAASWIEQALRGGEIPPEMFATRHRATGLALRSLRAKTDGRGNRRNDRGAIPANVARAAARYTKNGYEL